MSGRTGLPPKPDGVRGPSGLSFPDLYLAGPRTDWGLRGNKSDLPKTVDVEELTVWEADWGEMHVNISVCHRHLDITPLLKGLPDNKCQCPHWGMVIRGRKVVKYGDREEVLGAGDAYFISPGHTTVTDPGTEWLEVSPRDELEKTNKAVARNLAAIDLGR